MIARLVGRVVPLNLAFIVEDVPLVLSSLHGTLGQNRRMLLDERV